MKVLLLAFAMGIGSASLACDVGPQSGRGLRLPPGDAARGELAFQELGCNTCHQIADEPNVPANDQRDVLVTLGGSVTRIESHGELVTSIVNPSHEISRKHFRGDVADGNASKMENFNDRMTVSQLIDLTEYLQGKYRIAYEPLYVP